jgi:putative flippase GtrA
MSLVRRLLRPFLKPFLSRRFLKFGAVGASGVIVNLGTLALLRRVGVHTNVASAIAIEISILSNFLINHIWTFQDRRGGHDSPSLGKHLFRFHLVSLGGGVIQFVIFVALNVVWLLLFGTQEEIRAYGAGAGTRFDRWVWHPFVEPPNVGGLIYLSQIFGIGAATIWNYLLNFYWTWAKKVAPLPAEPPVPEGPGQP